MDKSLLPQNVLAQLTNPLPLTELPPLDRIVYVNQVNGTLTTQWERDLFLVRNPRTRRGVWFDLRRK